MNNNSKNKIFFIVYLIIVLTVIGSVIFQDYSRKQSSKIISYETLKEKLTKNTIYEVEITKDIIYAKEKTLKPNIATINAINLYNLYEYKNYKIIDGNASTLIKDVEDNMNLTIKTPQDFYKGLIGNLIIWLILPCLCVFINYRVNKNKHNVEIKPEKEEKLPKIQFKDVAGEDEAKESLQELVDFLKDPKKYNDIGAKLPKGALMVGPPGCGKTLLAKALAGEAGVPFFQKSASEFVEMYVGVGASRVRDLFTLAKANSPCVVFIDEIDAIGKSRTANVNTGSDSEKDQTLNQLLTELDGFNENSGIIVLGATNQPEILDKALVRPGRFDRRIIVEKPDLKGRREIFNVHLKNVKKENIEVDELGLMTSGSSGADIANCVNEACILAVKENRKAITQNDLKKAFEIVMVGKEKKDRILSEKEKNIVSIHETGHAFITYIQTNTEPVAKISIIPVTSGALGYVMQSPEEERYLNTKEELLNKITIYLGGRAAEEIFFDSVTTGAANDLEKATDLAYKMVGQVGMGQSIGLASFLRQNGQYLDNSSNFKCSQIIASEIDKEVINILNTYYNKAKSIILENKEIIQYLANYLYKHETITGKEFIKLIDSYKKKER